MGHATHIKPAPAAELCPVAPFVSKYVCDDGPELVCDDKTEWVYNNGTERPCYNEAIYIDINV